MGGAEVGGSGKAAIYGGDAIIEGAAFVGEVPDDASAGDVQAGLVERGGKVITAAEGDVAQDVCVYEGRVILWIWGFFRGRPEWLVRPL